MPVIPMALVVPPGVNPCREEIPIIPARKPQEVSMPKVLSEEVFDEVSEVRCQICGELLERWEQERAVEEGYGRLCPYHGDKSDKD